MKKSLQCLKILLRVWKKLLNMNECIIHYDGLSCYDDLVFVTKRTLKLILLAKEEHKKRNDRQIFQCKLAQKENILR